MMKPWKPGTSDWRKSHARLDLAWIKDMDGGG